ncbi:MAG: glycerophosphodiester phosphodiesterase [Oscillospiraceae bacterium]|nr:glycerophosphodiester phosphodiesterase [Oscillospiraceae bacterium]
MSMILAHRGASGYAPENTLEAFRLAMEMGADGFELDVHMSLDGHLVVIHDETVDRTTDGTGLVRELTLEQLKALDAANGMSTFAGSRIPTLEEVFRLVQNTHHTVNVEVKTDEWFYPGIEEACLELTKQMGLMDRVIFSSFNHHTLIKLHELDADAKLGMLFGDIMVRPWEYARALPVHYLHPMKMNIYLPGFAEDTYAAGYGINMWTINDEETMFRCLKDHAGIITNYPDLAVSLRRQHSS